METQEPPPNHLYKYKAIDENGYWRDIISEHRIFFPSLDKLNDPFEGKYRFSYEATPEVKAINLAKQLMLGDRLENKEKHNHNYLQEAQNKIADGWGKEDTMRHIENQVHIRIINRCGLLSLSESKDDILLWSHYADSHRGICIEYDTSKAPSFFKSAKKIKYQEERNKTNYYEAVQYSPTYYMLFVKSIKWEYEKEWRVLTNEPNTKLTYPPKTISAIYIGLNCEIATEREIKKILNQHTHRVPLFKARMSENDFKLEFDEIEY